VASKLEQFLSENKLDRRRIVASSRAIENLRPEDRATRLARRRSKGDAKEGGADAKPAKPRSGRPVTERLLNDAIAGRPVTGPAKTRLLRAVNRILEQKKREPVNLRALF
jgi:hypothetical protein